MRVRQRAKNFGEWHFGVLVWFKRQRAQTQTFMIPIVFTSFRKHSVTIAYLLCRFQRGNDREPDLYLSQPWASYGSLVIRLTWFIKNLAVSWYYKLIKIEKFHLRLSDHKRIHTLNSGLYQRKVIVPWMMRWSSLFSKQSRMKIFIQ